MTLVEFIHQLHTALAPKITKGYFRVDVDFDDLSTLRRQIIWYHFRTATDGYAMCCYINNKILSYTHTDVADTVAKFLHDHEVLLKEDAELNERLAEMPQ